MNAPAAEMRLRAATLHALWKAAQRGRELAGSREDPTLSWDVFDLRIVDLRPAAAYLEGHIPGSGSLPAIELESRIYELPPRWRPLILVAGEAAAARQAADLLREKGWQRATPLGENVRSWPGPWATGPPRGHLWEPTPAVHRWAPRLGPGRVLDLGCGSGRDAVYLARRGHEVLAVDLLPDALARAEQLAARSGVTIATRRMDLRKTRPPVDQGFGTILMLRFLERDLLTWMKAALQVGGIVILETFSREALCDAAPRAERWTLEPREALHAFAADSTMRVIEYMEETDPDGVELVRIVARKETV